jgi:4-hydroxy-tetrahydrodipicolinate reductase
MTLRVAVTGASGRMGQAVARAVNADDNAELAAFIARPGSALLGTEIQSLLGSDSPSLAITDTLSLTAVDVVIDFTLPESTLANANLCADAGVPIVIGTTGFSDDQLTSLDASLASVASCRAANFSTGVNLAYRLLAIAAEVMGADADIEIHEAHHKHKIDAPSGTALAMGQAITDAMGTSLNDVAQYDRSAVREAREPGSIGFSVTRSGDIVGEHTVMFGAEGERLEITHKASSRNAFAAGALRAAHFLQGKPAGSYRMADVLGLS